MARKWTAVAAIILTGATATWVLYHDFRDRAALQYWTDWSRSQGGKVEEYHAFLQARNVAGIISIRQLLVSAREPGKCPGFRYEVPPQSAWGKSDVGV